MSDGSCKITVVGPARRADLTLPDDVAVAELIPDLVQLLDGEQQADAPPRRWSLLRVGGGALDLERGLEEQAVRDGAMVFLRDTSTPPPPPVVEDVVEAVAIVVDVRPGRWTGAAARTLGTAVAGVCAAAAAWASLATPDGAPRAALALGAALLLVAAAGALRAAGQAVPAAVLALSALPLWAVGGAAASGAIGAGAPAPLALAAAAVAVGALAAWLAAPAAAAPAAGTLVAALPVAVVVAAGEPLRAGATREAAVAAVLALVVADQLPRLATVLAGLSGLPAAAGGPGGAADGPALRVRVDSGHRGLAWLHAGAALTLAGALVVLAAGADPVAWVLCAAAALAVALRTRRFRFTAEVVPLAAAALAGPLALEAVLAGWLRTQGTGGAVAAVALALGTAAVALALALAAPRLATSSPGRRRLLDLMELTANLALVPLVVAVLGVFALVYDAAHRMA